MSKREKGKRIKAVELTGSRILQNHNRSKYKKKLIKEKKKGCGFDRGKDFTKKKQKKHNLKK